MKVSGKNILIYTILSFAGGVAVGLLLSPKSGRENRKWIAENADEMSKWLDQQTKNALENSEERIDKLSENLQSKINQNVPDPYTATRKIDLKDEDLMDE